MFADIPARTRLLTHFGNIWQVRLQNPEMASYFYRQALEIAYEDPSAAFSGHLAAFRSVKTVGAESGIVEGIVSLAERMPYESVTFSSCGIVSTSCHS